MKKIYDVVCLITGFFALGLCVWGFMIGYSPIYSIITFCISLLYFLGFTISIIGNNSNSIIFLGIATSVWVSVANLLVGGNFAQGSIILVTIAITYTVYRTNLKLRNWILGFQIVPYILSIIYVNENKPIFGTNDFPYDELLVFIGTLGWILTIYYRNKIERKSLIDRLKVQNKELVQTTEELERFTYIASHDLKSPLRTIINFIGLIEKDLEKGSYEKIKDKLSFVKSGATQMNYLVQDILELSLLKDETNTSRTSIDLNKVLEKALTNLSHHIESKKAVINNATLPFYHASEMEFLLLFQNIVQNGIKYNDSPTPTIDIDSEATSNHLIIKFRDNGIGIQEKYQGQIFQFFKRLHNSQKYSGTGLGLGLCKKIVTSYNGKIEVVSKVGEGSTFLIKLPLSPNTKEKELETSQAKVEL